MEIAILLFDRITALDAIGPYEVLSRLPDASVRFVGKTAGLVRSDNSFLGLCCDAAITDVAAPDVLVVPGGFGTAALERDVEVLDWVRQAHETSQWTTSVCSGSLVLGAAGLLSGLEATTHWALLDRLGEFGARPVSRRVVEQGKIVTAAGVSSGIDMALTLAAGIAGETIAQAIQLSLEYDPTPPFDSGSPQKASEAIVGLARKHIVAAWFAADKSA